MTDQTDPAALVKAALERAADHVSDLNEVNARRVSKTIRALADDPKAVAEIIERAKGEGDE